MANNSNVEQGLSGFAVSFGNPVLFSNPASSCDPNQKTLRQNPFTTYRDPQTGLWVVVKPVPAMS